MRFATLLATIGFILAGTLNLSAEDKGKKGTATVAGKVKSVDEKAGSITMEGRTKEGNVVEAEQTYTLAKDVKVTAGKDAKALTDVKAGSSVTLTLTDDKKTVTGIALAGARKKEGDK